MKKTLASTIVISLIIVIGTVIAILYAQGYRITGSTGAPILQESGLLALTSKPEGASVYIDDNLTTATDDTIYLDEGTYDVRVEKDGYFPWKKTVTIKKGVVSNFQIRLFPATPKLDPITRSGVNNPVVDPSGRLITYTVNSGQLKNHGIYTLNMANRPINPFGSATTQLVSDIEGIFDSSLLTFSPSGSELLASTAASQKFLLAPNASGQDPENVTVILNQIQEDWEEQAEEVYEDKIQALPSKLRPFARENFTGIQLSPGNEKVLYTASNSAQMPPIVTSTIPGQNPTEEDRNLQEGDIYVYDTKDDKNYLLFNVSEIDPTPTGTTDNIDDVLTPPAPPKFIWHPTSSNLFYVRDGKINVIEYDGTNRTTLYAGPFQNNFIYPWPDGSSLVILTNLNLPDSSPNLYSLSLE